MTLEELYKLDTVDLSDLFYKVHGILRDRGWDMCKCGVLLPYNKEVAYQFCSAKCKKEFGDK